MAILIQPVIAAPLVDQTFPLLKTKTATYTNVTVTTRAESYVFIVFDGGMASIKVSNLSLEAQRALGYIPAEPDPAIEKPGPTVVAARQSIVANIPIPAQMESLKQWQSKLQDLKITSEVVYTVLAIVLLVYLAFCYCCSQICIKAGSPGGALVWIPVLQLLPLVRAAGMSDWWFLGLLIPGLNILGQILWCINIVKARGKSVWVTILLLLPVTSFFAFLYLAFSNEAVEEFTPKKFQTRAFQPAA
jgi:hypothetical protein